MRALVSFKDLGFQFIQKMFRIGDRPLQLVMINSGCSYEFPADVIFISEDGARVYTENEKMQNNAFFSPLM